eukprot:TRINITY_DN3126_c0_g1_i1.p1 TRINITY_DN3126_c0_g1~~TRINITY_DN3126_c0_g1_i1.p1  ORF type:complete len:683 (+),score=56.06 TRINITY_DN3126_c0_g1_i1:106-2154(+)
MGDGRASGRSVGRGESLLEGVREGEPTSPARGVPAVRPWQCLCIYYVLLAGVVSGGAAALRALEAPALAARHEGDAATLQALRFAGSTGCVPLNSSSPEAAAFRAALARVGPAGCRLDGPADAAVALSYPRALHIAMAVATTAGLGPAPAAPATYVVLPLYAFIAAVVGIAMLRLVVVLYPSIDEVLAWLAGQAPVSQTAGAGPRSALRAYSGGDGVTPSDFVALAADVCPWAPRSVLVAAFASADAGRTGTLDQGALLDAVVELARLAHIVPRPQGALPAGLAVLFLVVWVVGLAGAFVAVEGHSWGQAVWAVWLASTLTDAGTTPPPSDASAGLRVAVLATTPVVVVWVGLAVGVRVQSAVFWCEQLLYEAGRVGEVYMELRGHAFRQVPLPAAYAQKLCDAMGPAGDVGSSGHSAGTASPGNAEKSRQLTVDIGEPRPAPAAQVPYRPPKSRRNPMMLGSQPPGVVPVHAQDAPGGVERRSVSLPPKRSVLAPAQGGAADDAPTSNPDPLSASKRSRADPLQVAVDGDIDSATGDEAPEPEQLSPANPLVGADTPPFDGAVVDSVCWQSRRGPLGTFRTRVRNSAQSAPGRDEAPDGQDGASSGSESEVIAAETIRETNSDRLASTAPLFASHQPVTTAPPPPDTRFSTRESKRGVVAEDMLDYSLDDGLRKLLAKRGS